MNMDLPPSPVSRTSLISPDPNIARQISHSKSPNLRLSSGVKPIDSNSSPEQQKHQPYHTARNERLEVRLLPKSLEKARKNSLRHVKDSTEVLRQRSTRSQHEAKASNGASMSKDGFHFTVGNVGTGGKLYLRYVLLNMPIIIILMR